MPEARRWSGELGLLFEAAWEAHRDLNGLLARLGPGDLITFRLNGPACVGEVAYTLCGFGLHSTVSVINHETGGAGGTSLMWPVSRREKGQGRQKRQGMRPGASR